MVRINRICIQQIVFNICRGFTEHNGVNRVQRQLAHVESVLKTALFTETHGHKLAAIACKSTQNANILFRDIAAWNQTHTEQIANPFGILFVILVALRYLILARAFHTDILAVVVKEPLLKIKQASIESEKTLLLVLGRLKIACDNCGNEKGLVNIDATTDWICEFH